MYLCPPCSDCHSPIVSPKRNLHYLICITAAVRPELVFHLKTSAGTSDVVVYCDCRHGSDDEESHHDELVEDDHVHEDHDEHCSASGTQDCLVMFALFNRAIGLYSGCSSVFTASFPLPWKGCTTLYWSLL